MRQIGVVVGDKLFSGSGSGFLPNDPPEPSRAVAIREEREARPPPVLEPASPEDEIDEIISMLTAATRMAQSMSPENRRRIRELFHASIALLNATTVLPSGDQTKFKNALHNRS